MVITFKDETGNVLYGSGYTTDLKTEWQHQMGYSTLSFGGSYVNIPFNEVSGVNVPVDGLDVSRTATHGTASGESGVTGSYSTGSTTLGMSNKAEVGGGLLDAKYENMYAASSVFNLIFSAGSTPVYLWIDYDYSIEFDTNVLDPTHWWEWQAGGAVRMNLIGGGSWYDSEGQYHFETVYPYDDPDKYELIKEVGVTEAGKPSGNIICIDGSLSPILLTRAGLDGVSWNLSVDVNAHASAPGVEGTTPAVPEPATMLLLGLGLMGLAGVRRKIQK